MKIGQSNRIKNEIVNKIMKSQDLLKLLYYPNTDVDIYDGLPDLTSSQRQTVRKENIYKRKRLPLDDTNEMKTYISMSYGQVNYKSENRGRSEYFKEYILDIYVITNEELDGIPQGSRVDEIEDVINEMFQQQDIKALEDCKVFKSGDIRMSSPYVGKFISITFKDYNRTMFSNDIK